MVEITDLTLIRQHNIQSLVADMGSLTAKQIAQKLGISYPMLMAVKRSPQRSNIGTKAIETIEAKLKLKDGWLDRDRRDGGSDDATPDQSAPAQTVSMNANGFVVDNKRITNFQANEIMKILLED